METFDRKKIINRVEEFTNALEHEHFPLHQNYENWRKLLLKSEIPFVKYGQNFKVDFKNIDFTGPEINHQEWRAQLNRFLWLNSCMVEDETSKTGYFAQIARDSVESFMKFRKDVTVANGDELWQKLGDNTLSISVRLGKRKGTGWWGTLPFMRESVIDDKFLTTLKKETLIEAEYMMENLTPCGNWRISQLSCLLFIGWIFERGDMVEKAVKGLNETFRSQVAEDGCHEEHTIGYHSWMAREFSSFYCLGLSKPELGIVIDPVKLVKMWDYVILSATPDKQHAGLNDSERWGCLNASQNTDRYDSAVGIRKFLVEEKGIGAKPINPGKSCHFPSAGHWFFKHNGKYGDQMLIFDATRYGGGHCHMGVNSVNFHHGGKMMLIDPGTFSYERSNIFTGYGRHTASHNTVCVDDMAQLPSTCNEAICDMEGRCVFIYNTYSNGYGGDGRSVAGVHERMALWIKDEFILVNDIIKTSGNHFTANFNLLPGDNGRFEGGAYSNHDGYGIVIKPIYSNCDLSASLYEASMDPMAGWLAIDGSMQRGGEPGSSIHFKGKVEEDASVAAYVLAPYAGSARPSIELLNRNELEKSELRDRNSRIYNSAVHYRIGTGSGEFGIVSAYLKYRNGRLHPSIGEAGEYESDGKLAVVEFKREKPVFAYLYDGTYLKHRGITLISEKETGNHERTL